MIAKENHILDHSIDTYVDLFDLVPCMITIQDKDYKIIDYNQEFVERFGEKKGAHCYHAYKGRSRMCTDCPLEKTFQDGGIHFDEQKGVNADGSDSYWLVKTSPIKDADGEIIAAMEMNIDITKQKQLKEQLKKSERKYFTIFNNIPNCLFVLDSDSLIIRNCNESAQLNYGYAKKELTGRSFLTLFKEKEAQKSASLIKSSHILKKVQHLHKNGSTLYVNIRISPFEYRDKTVFIVSCSNITKEIETEQMLIQACKLTTLGEMASGIAHELNQPLSVIKSASSFIIKNRRRQKEIDPSIVNTMLEKIDDNVDRASSIITHMRNFSRKTDMEVEPVQINHVIERAFHIFTRQLTLRGIKVVKELDPDIPTVLADPNCLEQVFINLILNARDALEEKWVTQGDKTDENKIIVKTYHDTTHVIAEFIDTGKGIPDAISKKIFEPFFTTKEVGQGTGLGLSISFSILKGFNAMMYADTNRKLGAAFIIRFPRKETAS